LVGHRRAKFIQPRTGDKVSLAAAVSKH
jgi:hypothetical protein